MHVLLVTQIHKDDCRHLGFDRVFAALWKNYYWTGMFKDVKSWLDVSETCQKAKAGVGRGKIDIKHENIEGPGVQAAMDLAVMPITKEGYKYLLVYQDYHIRKVIVRAWVA